MDGWKERGTTPPPPQVMRAVQATRARLAEKVARAGSDAR